ncbi:MAG: HEAT repeat domain-containing protein [Planctomycetota bacterium]
MVADFKTAIVLAAFIAISPATTSAQTAIVLAAFIAISPATTSAQTASVDDSIRRLRDADVAVVGAQLASLRDSSLNDSRVIAELVILLDDLRILEKRMAPAGSETIQDRAWYCTLKLNSSAVPRILASMKTLRSDRAIQLALAAIARIGKEDASIFAELMPYTRSATVVTRSHAIGALDAVGGNDSNTVAQLAAFLKDDHPNVRWATVNTLRKRLDHLGPALEILIELLNDDSDVHVLISNHAAIPQKLCGRVAELLAEIGPPAKSAIPRLRQLMNSFSDQDVRVWAACAVCMISETAPPDALEVIGEVLLSGMQKKYGGNDAAAAITKLGPRGLPLVDELQNARNHKSPTVRRAIIAAFFAVDPEKAISRTLPLVEDKDELVAQTAIRAISSRCNSDREVIDSYIAALERFDGIYSEPANAAIDALEKLGALAESAIPALKRLSDNDKAPETLREKAALAAKRIEQP